MCIRLVNWRKRLAKLEDDRLLPGEDVVATMVLQVRGAVLRGAIVGGLSGARQAASGSSAVYVPGGAVARATTVPGDVRYGVRGKLSRIPVKPLLLVLTDFDRVLVYSFDIGTIALTYATELRGTDIRSIDVRPGFFARKATLAFNDGASVRFDLPRGHDHKAFCRRFRGSGGGRP